MASGFVALAILAVVASYLVVGTSSHPVRYDQRQEGDLNVRTDVEDVVLVVVPPKDLLTAGMGMVAASAANLLKKNYISEMSRPERWHYRPHSKWSYASLDKAPFKVDLGKTEFHKKKVVHHGDPNRYNIHDDRVPVRSAPTVEAQEVVAPQMEAERTTVMPVTTVKFMTPTEKGFMEMTSNVMTEENKTVKKDLNTETKMDAKTDPKGDMEMADVKTDMKTDVKTDMKTNMKAGMKTDVKADVKPEEKVGQKVEQKPEMTKEPVSAVGTTDALHKKVVDPKVSNKKTESGVPMVPAGVPVPVPAPVPAIAQDVPKVVGELTPGALGPTSIFSHEGCGPDAYRDLRGICIYKKNSK